MECSIRKWLERQFTRYLFECCTSYINEMGHTQSDTYSSLYNKSDNVNVDETFVRKSALVHVLMYSCLCFSHSVSYHFDLCGLTILFLLATVLFLQCSADVNITSCSC